jgi:hypothetical protein
LLGDISQGSHEKSKKINDFFGSTSLKLADALGKDDPNNLAIDILRGDDSAHSADWRLAEALTLLMGTDRTTEQLQRFFSSCLMVDEAKRHCRRRRRRLKNVTSGQKTGYVTP